MIEFVVSLIDKASAPAKKAGASLTSAAQSAKVLQSALKSVESAMVKAQALGDTAKIEKLTAQHGKFSSALQSLQPQLSKESAALDTTGGAASAMSGKIAAMGGPIGIAIAVLAALATAALAVAAAFVGLIIKGAEVALEMAELREKTIAVFGAYAGGRSGAEALIGTLDTLRASLGMTRAELIPLTTQLLQMGVKASDVAGQLTALASIKALGIEGGQEKYLSLLAKVDGGAKAAAKSILALYEASGLKGQLGEGVDKLAKQLKAGTISAVEFQRKLQAAVTAKGADALAAQANSLGATWARLKENLGLLFEGIDVKPFLAALKDLAGIFGQDQASGIAMKGAITGAFNAIFAEAAKVLPYIKKGFEYAIIFALQLYIAVKPLGKSFAALWASSDGSGKTLSALSAVATWLGMCAHAAIATVTAFVEVAQATGAMLAWFGRGADAAENLISGLVGGIVSGTGAVIDAIKGLGTSAIGALKGVLHISSPSRVMAELGGFTAEGFSQGIGEATPKVATAARGMAHAATAPARGGGAAAGTSGGNTFTVTINVEGGGRGWEEITEEAVSTLFEKIALMQGVHP